GADAGPALDRSEREAESGTGHAEPGRIHADRAEGTCGGRGVVGKRQVGRARMRELRAGTGAPERERQGRAGQRRERTDRSIGSHGSSPQPISSVKSSVASSVRTWPGAMVMAVPSAMPQPLSVTPG